MNPEEIFRERNHTLFSQTSRKYARDHIVKSLRVFLLLLFSPRIQNHPPSLQQSVQRTSDSDGKRRGRVGPWSRAPGESDSPSNWD